MGEVSQGGKTAWSPQEAQAGRDAATTCDTVSSVLGLTRRKRRTKASKLPSALPLACVYAHIMK